MPTVTSSAPWSDVIEAGNTLTVSRDRRVGAVVQRSYGSDVVESVGVTTSRTFGPYLRDMTFRVSAVPGATVVTTEATDTGQVAGSAGAVSGAGISADSGNVLTAGSDQKPYYNGAGAGGLASWISGRLYTAGTDRVLAPGGGVVTCKTTHTSGSFYDARQWIAYSDDGASVFDFTQLPDGLINTVRPARGSMSDFGIADAFWAYYRVKDGALKWNSDQAGRGVHYLQLELNSKQRPVQHIWAYVECAASPESNQACTILIPGPYKWNSGLDQNRAGIHWLLLGNVSGSPASTLTTGPYNVPGAASGPNISAATPNAPFPGRKFRVDITVNAASGLMRGYINGTLVVQYTDSVIAGYISPYGCIEFDGPSWSVREFGISANLPSWDGVSQPAIGGGSYFANGILSTTWQKLHDFKVTYSDTGWIAVDWNPYINCPAGRVDMDLSTFDTAPSPTFPNRMCEAGTNGRVYFRQLRQGTPGATERIGIWARIQSTATAATVRESSYGESAGPSWGPVAFNPIIP